MSNEMFGCDIEEFMESMHQSATFRVISKRDGKQAAYHHIATSILSDVQEMIVRGMNEDARTALNRVKYILNLDE